MSNKKLMMLTAVLAFAALLTMPLSAQAGCCQKKSCDKTMTKDMGCMMKDTLKLTAEQSVKLEKMHAEMQKVMAEQHAAMQKAHEEMKDLMKKGDATLLDAKIDEISKMQATMQKKHMAHRMAVRTMLNDDQKAKFDEMACGMMAGHGCCQMHACKMDPKTAPKAEAKKTETAPKGVACGDDCSKCDLTKKSKK